MLRVNADAPHFAPSVETVDLRYLVPMGKVVDDLILEITGRSGTLVFRMAWGNAVPPQARYIWDGENNQAPPVLAANNTPITQYVNPLDSPYTAKFIATLSNARPPQQPPQGLSTGTNIAQNCPRRRIGLGRPPDDGNAVQEGTVDVKVFYREIKIEPMTWLETYKLVSEQADGTYPQGASVDVKKMWFQYKLNELGYMAGPIENPPQDVPIMRALYRYTQSHTDNAALPKVYDVPTLTAGAPGTNSWGWKTDWEGKYGTLAALCQGPVLAPGTALLQKLVANDRPRNDVFDTAKLLDRLHMGQVIVDHDIFYINGENTDPDAHSDYDKEFLNPYCLPLKVRILLVSKADLTASGAGIDAPAAVGPAQCEWCLYDPPENLEVLPEPVTADVPDDYKSKTKRYIGQVHAKRANQTLKHLPVSQADKLDVQDNCPVDLGGFRNADGMNTTGRFVSVFNVSTSVSPDAKRFYSIANTNVANPHQQLGRTAVYFQGSYIAGDNAVLQVRLSWNNIPDKDTLRTNHQQLPGLAASFGTRKCLPVSAKDPMVQQTCRLTTWRRHHVLREVTWAENLAPATNWGPVVANFKACHIILVPPANGPIHIENLLLGPARTALLQSMIDGVLNTVPQPISGKIWPEFNDPNKGPTFHRGGLYPIQFPDFDTASPAGPLPAKRYATFCNVMDGIRNEWPTYSFLRPFFQKLREEFDKLGNGPGLIILRGALLPKPGPTHMPLAVSQATANEQAAYEYPYRSLSAGGDHGIVFLDDNAASKFEETFFVSHEIGHCLFLTHPFQWAGDHDADQNCVMTYNIFNGGEPLGWASNPLSVPTQFHLRIDLSANKRGIASYGTVTGNFVEVDPKTYWFSGDIPTLRQALVGFRFAPDSKTTFSGGDADGQRVPKDTVITIKLGPEAKKTPPATSVPLPYSVDVPITGSAVKPFGQITLIPPNPTAMKPFFCGKCVLKLRGWRVREDNTRTNTPVNMPPQVLAVPVNPVMTFEEFKISKGGYYRNESGNQVLYEMRGEKTSVGGVDKLIGGKVGWPRGFLHVHKLAWESSDGNPASLQDVETREHVRFLQSTTAPPFNDLQDPDGEFTQGGQNHGRMENEDDHSTCHPALICAFPRVAGVLVGHQWYQWRRGQDVWQNIEGAAYLLEKRVFQDTDGEWVFSFKKTNLLPHNTKPFHFEAHYTIPDPPPNMPATYGDIMTNLACTKVTADIKKWAKRVVSKG